MKFFLAALSLAAADTPAAPVWPETFTQEYEETVIYPVIGKKTTKGTYYFDISDKDNMMTRIDRDNGQWDRYCGLTHGQFSASTCNQYIVGGDRYIHYADTDDCCYCCSADHGCGVLRNDWISDGDFLGVEDMDGVSTYKWNKQGLQANWYYETVADAPEDRIPIKTDMGPGESTDFIQDFIPGTFKKSVDPGVFDLPKSCSKSKKCNLLSVCTTLRGENPMADQVSAVLQ